GPESCRVQLSKTCSCPKNTVRGLKVEVLGRGGRGYAGAAGCSRRRWARVLAGDFAGCSRPDRDDDSHGKRSVRVLGGGSALRRCRIPRTGVILAKVVETGEVSARFGSGA